MLNLDDLKKRIEYCHSKGLKSYVITIGHLETLITWAEIGVMAEELAHKARMALLDHDLELARNHLNVIEGKRSIVT